ncbi:hypothetical protein MJO28_001209 [Puccinia striiformis f. sp. tritici]|uniref:Uncharacterized protein n=1 Tax=Puccinia striiformis f. sp. tritici TaxID=168172 RepID=A0ACC0F1K6_9BASI|nr:hypothetical protein MJO28_001209 [Puccinia striiformis f. sp. tritici]
MAEEEDQEQKLICLLKQSLNPTTQPLARRELDQNLKTNLPDQDPVGYLNLLTKISINSTYPIQLRIHALVLLRTIPLDSSNKIWSTKLNSDQQRLILNQLFKALLTSSVELPEIINQLARVIADLAKNSPEITLQSSDEWSSVLRPILLANLLPQQQQQQQQPAQPILQTALLDIFVALPWLFSSSPEQLESIVLASLGSDHFPLRLAALQAICVPTLELETSFTEPVLQAVLLPLPSHPNQSQVETALTYLIEFVTFNDVSDLTTWLEPLLRLTLDQNQILSTRSTALECMITLIESRSPATNLSPSLPWLSPVFQALVSLMAEIEEDEDWCTSLDDEEEDLDAIYIQAEQALDRLTQEVTRSHTDQLFELILSAIQQDPLPDSWKAKHALLSVLAVTGEGLAESFALATEHIYHILQAGFDDHHPRVIYAAIYAIAQLSSPLKITFSTKPIHQQVLSWLLRSLENQSQPRLQAFSAKALINVLWDDGYNKVEIADEMVGPILERLLALCGSQYTDRKSQSNRIRLDALNAIAKLFASMSQQGALAFFDTTILTLRKLVDQVDLVRSADPRDEGINDEELDETELKVFEAISRLALTSGQQRFDVEADWWANRMVHSIELRTQAQIRILSSLAGLSGGMNPERFVNSGFLKILISKLVAFCISKPDISVSALYDHNHQFDDRDWESVLIGEQTFGIKSAELIDKEIAIKTLILLTNQIGVWLIPFCDQIVGAVVPLLKFYFSDEVRESVLVLLPLLVQSAKASGMTIEQVEGVSTSFCNSISSAFEVEPLDTGNLSDSLLLSWAECAGYQSPSSTEVTRIAEFCCQRIQRVVGLSQNHTGEEEEDKEYEDCIRGLFTGISRVLRISISIYPDLIYNLLHQNVVDWAQIVITPSINPSNRPSSIAIGLKRLGFRLVGAFVKFSSSASSLSQSQSGGEVGTGTGIHHHATILIEKVGQNILLGFNDQDDCIRGLAPFIVGLCAEKNGEKLNSIYIELIKSSMDLLVSGLQSNSNSGLNNRLLSGVKAGGEAAQVARENCVSALAKIIRNPEGLVIDLNAILPLWIHALPIQIDIEEVEPSYGLLLELIARGHESVDPTKNEITRIEQVINSLLSVILNENLNLDSRNSLSIALRAYLTSIPTTLIDINNLKNLGFSQDSVWARLDQFFSLHSS